ncbi:MAG: DNA repair protein RecO [Bacteroidales bacterium]|jgi:DNA repair protein RecO (recombination protein O)|nr:DNA repair protein RecO [Bacteroidales bacterium]MDD4702822.1 DNA repair protein RecO [Bacteroidales bacterium]MDX9798728.1 DNA repair protein RecO [Bacteroidales bacterium]
MIYATKGIVLRSFPYLESSSIVRILTKEFGVKSYVLKAGRKQKTTLRSNLFQPLYILELQVYNNPKKEIQIISEAKIGHDLSPLFSNIKKTTLAFFLSEIINQCLKGEERSEELYDFIEENILKLNTLTENYSIFHLSFLLELTEHLGFKPRNNYSLETPYFDILKGHFVNHNPYNYNQISQEDSLLLSNFLFSQNPISENYNLIKLSKEEKNKILNILIQFYQTHILSPNSIKSHLILAEVLH